MVTIATFLLASNTAFPPFPIRLSHDGVFLLPTQVWAFANNMELASILGNELGIAFLILVEAPVQYYLGQTFWHG